MVEETVNGITFYRVNSDIYGNPRYVVHFLAVLPKRVWEDCNRTIAAEYALAINLSHKWGGAKYRGKDFGGGIVVQSYNLEETAAAIIRTRDAAK